MKQINKQKQQQQQKTKPTPTRHNKSQQEQTWGQSSAVTHDSAIRAMLDADSVW